MIPTTTIYPLLSEVARWAATHPQITAVALVGSYAREQARPDSDIDLVILTPNPTEFRQQSGWMEDLGWVVTRWQDEDYGAVWSRRCFLSTGLEIEISFGLPDWASTTPLDEGTREVVTDGCWIILDPSGILNRLMRAL